MGQLHSRLRQNRGARTIREIAPRRTPGHEAALPQLTRDSLMAGLNRIASYIRRKGGCVTVIAVGGAVNTILLRSRQATHDVDFFNDRLTRQELVWIVEGAREAAAHDRQLAEEWFNNRTIFFIPKDVRAVLTDESFLQREVVFSAPGLTILASPWNYAFCCKIDRISGGGLNAARLYDMSDAIQYIHRHVCQSCVSQVSKDEVKAWCTRYSLRWTPAKDNAVAQANQGYRAQFRVNYDVIY